MYCGTPRRTSGISRRNRVYGAVEVAFERTLGHTRRTSGISRCNGVCCGVLVLLHSILQRIEAHLWHFKVQYYHQGKAC